MVFHREPLGCKAVTDISGMLDESELEELSLACFPRTGLLTGVVASEDLENLSIN